MAKGELVDRVLKRAGAYEADTLGPSPVAAPLDTLGPALSREHPDPVFLDEVPADYESVDYSTARWVTPKTEGRRKQDIEKTMQEFRRKNDRNLYVDGHGDLCYLAPNRWNLEKVQERHPDVIFEETREHT